MSVTIRINGVLQGSGSDRSSHTGTQTASTISDFADAVRETGVEEFENYILEDASSSSTAINSTDHDDPADAVSLGLSLPVTGDNSRPVRVDVSIPLISVGGMSGGTALTATIGVWDGTTLHVIGVLKYNTNDGFVSVAGTAILAPFSGTKNLALKAYWSAGATSANIEIYRKDWDTVEDAPAKMIATFIGEAWSL